MKKYLFIAAALLAIGCNNDDSLELANNEIKVVANLPTRATMTSFEQGDRMGLYAVEHIGDQAQPLQVRGNYLNNEPMVYDGTKWSSGRTLYWSAQACDFYGIYPYQPMAAVDEILFEVKTDQNVAETADALSGYEASDLMWAKAEKVAQKDGVVNLQFHHMMSRLVVKIVTGPKFEGEIPDDIVTHIYNTATTAKVNYQIGSLEKYSLSKNKTITMRKIDNRTFDAIIVPQFIGRSTPLVEITMELLTF